MEFTVTQREAQPYVAIPATATLEEWGRVNALFPEILAHVSQNGHQIVGPPFIRYWTIGDHERPSRVQVGVPIARGVPCMDRILSGTIPAGRYATATHTGHPDDLFEIESQLVKWMESKGLTPATHPEDGGVRWDGRFQFFPTDPREEPDPTKWKIEVAVLLTGDAG